MSNEKITPIIAKKLEIKLDRDWRETEILIDGVSVPFTEINIHQKVGELLTVDLKTHFHKVAGILENCRADIETIDIETRGGENNE